MEISVENISPVDKEVVITAGRDDLEPKFNEAYKKYQGQINMPGFRPGKVPLKLVRKRFGDEIEQEEVGKYVQEIYEKEVVPEHNPVGETQMTELNWEDDRLEARFKIGARPDFELADLSTISIDRMVHDVTAEEVQKEIDHALEQQGNWETVDEPAGEDSKVTVDAVHLDEEGEPIEEETDEDQVIDLRKEEFERFRDDLVGKKPGDEVDVEVGEEDDRDGFRLVIKGVQTLHKAKLTDEFAKQQTNGEASNVDEYRSLLKSRIQEYYDNASEDLFKNDVMEALTSVHDFEVPEVFLEQVQNQYVQRLAQQQEGELPEDFDEEGFKEENRDRALRDAKWFFIHERLQEKFDDIEIKPEDIDRHLEAEAARYGVSVDQMRNLFAQNPQQLEGLRNSIRENKVFDRLMESVEIEEIDRDTYQQRNDEKIKARG
ncbi:MAG: trigger factor [Balneolaceae bacterium]|nr:trigger factor [Balneolaceae bacterium]